MRRTWMCCAWVAVIAVFMPHEAVAQEPSTTDRERMLTEKIDALEKRVGELEREQAGRQSEPGAASEQGRGDLQERLARVEEKIADQKAPAPNDFRVFWKDGLRFQTEDGNFDLQIGGRLKVDYTWFDQDKALKRQVFDENDGGAIRSARVDLRGRIYHDLMYRLQYEFAGNDGPGGFADAYVGLSGIPYAGTLLLGHFKEPFGLEQLTSSNDISFMERSLPNAFAPGRNLGVQLNNAYLGEPKRERLTYAIGMFKATDNSPSANDADEDQGVAVTGRLTALPWYRDDGRRLLHLGLSYSLRNPDGATVNPYEIRPAIETNFAQFRWLNSEAFSGFRLRDARPDDVRLLGTEAALVLGTFSLQGEYARSDVDSTFGGNLEFDGGYVQASYFLTGESRTYKHGAGVFDRIVPRNSFGWGKGLGAWELAARFSTIDLDSGGVLGGEADSTTIGVNWYLNPNTRWFLNYTRADISHGIFEGEVDAVQARVQVDF